jgi:HD-GYP domain-containing protein (c-di-GMP phosphodiesterase class II)
MSAIALATGAVALAAATLLSLTLGVRRRASRAEDDREQRELEVVGGLNATIEARDPAGAGRAVSVRRLALALGRELGLRPRELETLGRAALLHDIGNLAVPDAVLVKPGPLDSLEYEQVKLHADEGAAIVARLSALHDVVPLVRHHHERWDGDGYPDGLAGEQIPLGAAIVAVADAWTAMTHDRPYRWRLSADQAINELLDGRGTQFAPDVVDAFLRAAGAHPVELLRPAC